MSAQEPGARSDLAGGAGWVALGLAVLALAWRMDRFEAMGATVYTMPGLVPGMLGALLMLMGAALALRGWRRRAAAGRAEPVLNRRALITLVLMLVYAGALVGRTPFWLATTLFVASFTALFAPEGQNIARRVAWALAIGALTSLVVVLVFERIFLVRLP